MALHTTESDTGRLTTATRIVFEERRSANVLPVAGTVDGRAIGGEMGTISTAVVDGVLLLSATLRAPGLPEEGVRINVPVREIHATHGCTRLTIDLGPAGVDALGGVLDLAPLVLDVSAVPGSGNLHGNPLCTGLPEDGGPLQVIAALLNRLITGLGV